MSRYVHKYEEPEQKVKLADPTRRNDAALEKLLEEFIKNRDKGVDKTATFKVD